MNYIALHHVKVAGRSYTPGEIFEADIPEQKEERLLRLGAIRRDAAPPTATAPAKPGPANKPPPPESPETHEDDPDDEDGYEESDEDAPEIDVMDGLVPKAAEEPPKPAPKPRPRAKAKPKPGSKGQA